MTTFARKMPVEFGSEYWGMAAEIVVDDNITPVVLSSWQAIPKYKPDLKNQSEFGFCRI